VTETTVHECPERARDNKRKLRVVDQRTTGILDDLCHIEQVSVSALGQCPEKTTSVYQPQDFILTRAFFHGRYLSTSWNCRRWRPPLHTIGPRRQPDNRG
jgi:hypothetical protein